jgi:hypothetical protein
VAAKDLRVEWRDREVLPALGQFAVLALLIANFGFDIDGCSHRPPGLRSSSERRRRRR